MLYIDRNRVKMFAEGLLAIQFWKYSKVENVTEKHATH